LREGRGAELKEFSGANDYKVGEDTSGPSIKAFVFPMRATKG